MVDLASFGGGTYRSRSMGRPWRKAVFTSSEFRVHPFEAISESETLFPSREAVGLSVLYSFSSSNPLAYNLALTEDTPSMSLGRMTHLNDIVS